MSKVKRVGKSFSTLPFDGIDNVANAWLHDDFITAEAVADVAAGTAVSSELEWTGVEAVVTTGPGLTTKVVGVAGHPGILRLTNAANAADATSLVLGAGLNTDEEPFVLDSNGIYIAGLIRIADVDATKVEFGLVGQAPAAVNSSALDVVSFVWDPADAANVGDELFIAQVNSAGTDVEEAFSLAYVESDWVLLEIYATSSDAYFKMSTEDGYEVVHLSPAAMPLVGVVPIFTVENVGAASEVLDIDAFHLRYGRQPYVGNTDIAWLGA